MAMFNFTKKRPTTASGVTATSFPKPSKLTKLNKSKGSQNHAATTIRESSFEFGYPVTFRELLTRSGSLETTKSFPNLKTGRFVPGQELRHKEKRISQETRD